MDMCQENQELIIIPMCKRTIMQNNYPFNILKNEPLAWPHSAIKGKCIHAYTRAIYGDKNHHT